MLSVHVFLCVCDCVWVYVCVWGVYEVCETVVCVCVWVWGGVFGCMRLWLC